MHLTKIYISITILLVALTLAAFLFLTHTRGLSGDALVERNSFVKLNTLPGLAAISEAGYIRHGALSDVSMAFDLGPEVHDIFPATYLYKAAPHISKGQGSK